MSAAGGDGRDWLNTTTRAIGLWLLTTPFVVAAPVAVLVLMAVVGSRRGS